MNVYLNYRDGNVRLIDIRLIACQPDHSKLSRIAAHNGNVTTRTNSNVLEVFGGARVSFGKARYPVLDELAIWEVIRKQNQVWIGVVSQHK